MPSLNSNFNLNSQTLAARCGAAPSAPSSNEGPHRPPPLHISDGSKQAPELSLRVYQRSMRPPPQQTASARPLPQWRIPCRPSRLHLKDEPLQHLKAPSSQCMRPMWGPACRFGSPKSHLMGSLRRRITITTRPAAEGAPPFGTRRVREAAMAQTNKRGRGRGTSWHSARSESAICGGGGMRVEWERVICRTERDALLFGSEARATTTSRSEGNRREAAALGSNGWSVAARSSGGRP